MHDNALHPNRELVDAAEDCLGSAQWGNMIGALIAGREQRARAGPKGTSRPVPPADNAPAAREVKLAL